MPKRSCPFGDAAPLQLKTRVGLRELSRGVRGEEYRREVFERTRRLLFRGAQAYMEGAAAPARAAEPGPAGEAQGEGSRWSGQLLIGHDGKLRRRPADRGECPGRVTEPRDALSWQGPSEVQLLSRPGHPRRSQREAESVVGMILKLWRGCGRGHFPEEPVVVPDHPLGEEHFPNIQPKPPLAQLETIPFISSLVTTETCAVPWLPLRKRSVR
uniref:Uncharacterized protein n=1 Tax=Junco hyemalis TaxID=40217 RepID=A0A8C5JBU5_JUNHY